MEMTLSYLLNFTEAILSMFLTSLVLWKFWVIPLRKKKQELEDQLHYSARMGSIGSMISGISYELNGPVTHIIGFVHLLKKNIQDDFSKKTINKISDSIERIDQVLKRLRSLGTYSLGEEKNFGINQAIINSIFFLENRFKEENINLRINLPEDIMLIFGDAARFEEMIQQILLNSFSAFKQRHKNSGEINILVNSIDMEKSNKKIELIIEDDAGGIDAEVLNHIFRPVVKNGHINSDAGLGLGLMMVKDSVIRHRGSIKVTSQNGKTQFRFLFPVSGIDKRSIIDIKNQKYSDDEVKDQNQVVGGSDRPLNQNKKIKIVVVDDERDIGEIVSLYLESFAEIIFFQDPLLAIQQLKNQQFDLLITDLKMPKMTGIQLAGSMKSISATCKVLLITGHDQNPEAIKSKYGYIDEVVFKPFNGEFLLEVVKRTMGLGEKEKKVANGK